MDSWLKIGFAVGAILWLGTSSTTVVIGYVLSAVIVMTSQLHFAKRLLHKEPAPSNNRSNEDWQQQIWSFAWPLSSWGVFTWAQQVSDRWALELFSTTEAVGVFAVLFQLGFVPASLATSLLISLISPIMFQHAGDATDQAKLRAIFIATRNITYAGLALTLLITIGLAIWHEVVFRVLVDERYHGFSHLLPWLTAAAGLQAAHHVLGIRISTSLKVRSILIPQIGSAIIFVALNFLGAFFAGLEGVVYSLAIASFIYFAWMLLLSRSILHDTQPPLAAPPLS